jgi:hypothetical protein
MHTLYALDLTGPDEKHSAWRTSRGPSGHRNRDSAFGKIPPDLPSDGFASPFGFWFAPAPSWQTPPPRFRVEFVAIDDTHSPRQRHAETIEQASSTGRAVGARRRAPAGRSSRQSSLPLDLEIDSNIARISVDVDTWLRVGETVLFAVAQYWRFTAINRTLDELSEWSRRDLASNSRFLSVINRARSRQLRALRRSLQTIILDLPLFEGPLTNPHGHCSSSRAVRLYRRLCRRLELGRFRREIDERIEVVETVLDSLSASLDHYQALAFQIALELIIVAVLLLDVGLYFVAALSK